MVFQSLGYKELILPNGEPFYTTLGHRVSTSPSGLLVLTEHLQPQSNNDLAQAALYVFSGYGHNPKTNSAVAHGLEHMLVERETSGFSGDDIIRIGDEMGFNFNAWVKSRHTKYVVKSQSENMFYAVSMMLDQSRRAKLRPDEFEVERGAIESEIRELESDPQEYTPLVAAGALFREDPFAYTEAGILKDVKGLTIADLQTFADNHYMPGNMMLFVRAQKEYNGVGSDMPDRFHQEIAELAEGYMGDSRSSRLSKEVRMPKIKVTGSVVDHVHRDIPELFITKVTQDGSHADSDLRKYLATRLLQVVMDRRVYNGVRQHSGLTYYAECFYSNPPENLFGIKTTCDPSDKQKTLDLIRRHEEELTQRPISSEEFNRQSQRLTQKIKNDYRNGTSALIRFKEFRLGSSFGYESMLRELETLTPNEVHLAAQEVFSKPSVLATLGKSPRRRIFPGLISQILS